MPTHAMYFYISAMQVAQWRRWQAFPQVRVCVSVTDVAVTILRLDVMHSPTITARTTGTPTHN